MLWVPSHSSMSYLSTPFLKIPVLLTAAYSMQLVWTPPTPPPKASEMKKDLSLILRPFSRLTIGIYWVNAISESAVILANALTSPLSNTILSLLVPGGSSLASNVQITPVWLIGAALMLTGAMIRLSCYRSLGRFFTFAVSIKKDQQLITDGPYSIVRHPSYTGIAMVNIGTILCLFGGGSWLASSGFLDSGLGKTFAVVWSLRLLAIPVALIRRSVAEDELLREEFGETWDEYAKRTPYRVIPYIF